MFSLQRLLNPMQYCAFLDAKRVQVLGLDVEEIVLDLAKNAKEKIKAREIIKWFQQSETNLIDSDDSDSDDNDNDQSNEGAMEAEQRRTFNEV